MIYYFGDPFQITFSNKNLTFEPGGQSDWHQNVNTALIFEINYGPYKEHHTHRRQSHSGLTFHTIRSEEIQRNESLEIEG